MVAHPIACPFGAVMDAVPVFAREAGGTERSGCPAARGKARTMPTPRRHPVRSRGFLFIALTLALLLPTLVATPSAHAAGACVVTSGADSGAGTLRAAIDQ